MIPDVDALSRCFGKGAFLRWHQTYTHGLPAIALLGTIAWVALPAWLDEPLAPIALAVGMLLHAGLDVTNTYGTAVLSPVSSRRFCTNWVFFVDAVTLVATVAAIGLQWLAVGGDFSPKQVAGGYGVFLLGYWVLRALAYGRARRRAPAGTVTLVPSAAVPWRYFGCATAGVGRIVTYRMNSLTERVDQQQEHAIFDDRFAATLSALSEFRIMRAMSAAYHVTRVQASDGKTRVTCRDLRVRNFGGRFGELVADVDAENRVIRRLFNV